MLEFLRGEPVRAVVGVIVAVLAVLRVLDVITADVEADIVALVLLLTGGEVARSRVKPV